MGGKANDLGYLARKYADADEIPPKARAQMAALIVSHQFFRDADDRRDGLKHLASAITTKAIMDLVIQRDGTRGDAAGLRQSAREYLRGPQPWSAAFGVSPSWVKKILRRAGLMGGSDG